MDGEGQLVPILREGIEIVKVIFFKELRDHLRGRRPDWEQEVVSRVTAAVVNELFGVMNEEPNFVAFAQSHRAEIDEARAQVGGELEPLRIPLTDALRTMVLCDYQEGRDTASLLQRAEACGILITERDLPLPNTFIELVRRLGQAKGILRPPTPAA